MSAVAKSPPPKMTSAEFLLWAEVQPEGRYELHHGEIVTMQSELVRHTVVKANVFRCLQDAVRARKLPCSVFTDGATVVIDDTTTYGPGAVVQCGGTVDLDAVTVTNPTIIVEVSSPSSVKYDVALKMPDYFSLPSVAHVLLVDPVKKRIIKHSRGEAPQLLTELLTVSDTLRLDPPGLEFAVANCFADT